VKEGNWLHTEGHSLDYGERLDLAEISVICCSRVEVTQQVIEPLLGYQSTGVAVCKLAGERLTKGPYANVSVMPLHGFLGL
jgi:hypothetical protein